MFYICTQKPINIKVMATIKGVTIGDKFINTTDKKSKRVSTVIDFSIKKSFITGETIEVLCIVEKEFMGQILRSEVVPVTVLRNKI